LASVLRLLKDFLWPIWSSVCAQHCGAVEACALLLFASSLPGKEVDQDSQSTPLESGFDRALSTPLLQVRTKLSSIDVVFALALFRGDSLHIAEHPLAVLFYQDLVYLHTGVIVWLANLAYTVYGVGRLG
jgi:hypothetical protein